MPSVLFVGADPCCITFFLLVCLAMAPPSKVQTGLRNWVKGLPTTPLSFDHAWADRFKNAAQQGLLSGELEAAYAHVAAKELTPAGNACGIRDLEEVNELVKADPGGVIFSGSLTQLKVADRALSTIDSGRIG